MLQGCCRHTCRCDSVTCPMPRCAEPRTAGRQTSRSPGTFSSFCTVIEGWEGERDDGVWVSTSKCNGRQRLVILRGGNQVGIGSWPKNKLDQSSGHKPEGTNETPRCFQA